MKDWLLQKLLNKSFWITLVRYGLFGLGVYLVKEGRIDQGQWEAISGAVLALAAALLGANEATKDKAVVDGKVVAKEKLPITLQADLAEAVANKKSRSVFDIFVGK